MTNKPNIDPNKYYSSRQVVMMNILPWRSPLTFNFKLTDKKWIEIFNPVVEQKKVNKRYYIKGENIIKFLKMAEEGKLYE